MSTWGIFLMKTMTNAHFTQVARSTLTCKTTSSFDNRLLHVLPRKPEQQWRLVVKLAGRAAEFHLWLQARRQDLAAGGQKPDGGAKNRRGGHIFKIQYWMYAATGGTNVKWGSTDFKWGGGHHWPPAGDDPVWLNIWNCRLGCFYN